MGPTVIDMSTKKTEHNLLNGTNNREDNKRMTELQL